MYETDANEALDVLHRARTSLTTGPFSFHDWTRCTCGHLYVGATGSEAPRRRDVRSPEPDTPYATAIIAVARTLARDEERFSAERRHWWQRSSPAALAARFVSDYTMRRARRDQDLVRRADAVAVVDEAIALLEPQAVPDVHERRLPA